MAMDRALRDKWIAALRSGEYQQQRDGFLFYGGEWCCLGVLCDIHPKVRKTDKGSFVYKDETFNTELPPILARELSLIQGQRVLVEMNDRGGKTFPEIADWIEDNL